MPACPTCGAPVKFSFTAPAAGDRIVTRMFACPTCNAPVKYTYDPPRDKVKYLDEAPTEQLGVGFAAANTRTIQQPDEYVWAQVMCDGCNSTISQCTCSE